MSWNYRVLVYPDGDGVFFQIHEVYYNNGVPNGYTESAIGPCGEDRNALLWSLERMLECVYKPYFWAGERFPEEYKPNKEN